MKTDTIFYRLFQSFPSIFFELIQHPTTEVNKYRFDSVEVKQLSFRIDGVFLPQDDNPETPIYFCEVQFQKDDHFYGRFFAEIFLYLSKSDLKNDWRGVIIYPNPQELLQLIETILVYKLPRLNRREVEAMFSLDELKQTRYFQDVLEEGRQEGRLEGKLESIPSLLALGLTVEQVAEALQLDIQQVKSVNSEQ